jgi:hypothetical protein
MCIYVFVHVRSDQMKSIEQQKEQDSTKCMHACMHVTVSMHVRMENVRAMHAWMQARMYVCVHACVYTLDQEIEKLCSVRVQSRGS